MDKVENTGVEKDSNTETTATTSTTTTITTTPALGTTENKEQQEQQEHVNEEPTTKTSSTEDWKSVSVIDTHTLSINWKYNLLTRVLNKPDTTYEAQRQKNSKQQNAQLNIQTTKKCKKKN